jgi:class 3 adenylate cyclase
MNNNQSQKVELSDHDAQHWLSRYALTKNMAMRIAVIWGLVALLVQHSGVGVYLETKLSDPVHFKVRALVNQSPQQSKRLKIYAIDDKAFAELQTPSLSAIEWAKLLQAMAFNQPDVIIIDAMLGARPSDLQSDIRTAFSEVAKISPNTKIVLGSFSTLKQISGRPLLNTDYDWYQRDFYQNSDVLGQQKVKSSDPLFAYGPHPTIADYFQRVGHIQLARDNHIDPFVKISGEKVLPHISLFAAKSVNVKGTNLVIDDARLIPGRDGSVLVNFMFPKDIRIKTILDPIRSMNIGKPIAGIEKGDVVLILPMYFTGHTDFRPSPFGLIPGGLYVASMINSVLNREWLNQGQSSEILLLVGLTVCFLLSLHAGVMSYWVGVIGFVLFAWLLSQISFVYFGVILSWLLPSLAVLVCGIHLFVIKTRATERKSIVLRSALDGAVDPVRLNRLLVHPERISLEPRERVVTLMFIDIVGFSLAAEHMLPRMAFENLKRLLGDMSKIIHTHGGVIDKSMGDGLLCYFGYRFDSNEASSGHALSAVRCAIDIQRESIKGNLASLKSGEPLFPLRIGINTASCFIGNVGDKGRIEFTVVGNGVNFAKRLEGACDMFCALIGETTYELVKKANLEFCEFSRRMVQIKHHKSLVDAYLVDPATDLMPERNELGAAFQDHNAASRMSERVIIREPDKFKLISDEIDGDLLNISASGVSVLTSNQLQRGQCAKISIGSSKPELEIVLSKCRARDLVCTVRWSYQAPGGYISGLSFDQMPLPEGEYLVQSICDVQIKASV